MDTFSRAIEQMAGQEPVEPVTAAETRPETSPGATREDKPGKPGEDKAADDTEAPAILVQHEVGPMQQRLEELLKAEGDLYQRGGRLVRLVKGDDGGEQIAEVTRPTLNKKASNYRWLVETEDKRGNPIEKRIKPPLAVLDALMDEKHWSLPVLRGITTAPTLLADGQVLDQPGYHAASGLFYSPSIAFDRVPEKVTREEALKLLERVKEVFEDFPFKSPEDDLAAVLGMVLTQLLRPAINGPVPMSMVRAPAAGSGKSLIPDIIAILATGAPALCHAYPKGNEEEVRKTIFTLALSGKPLVCFDNMTGSLKSPTLCNYLTSRTFGARILTTMTALDAPSSVVIYATGNNIRPIGDLVRRTVCVDIDAGEARPEFREGFKHADLRAFVRENRKSLVPAVLGLVRAYQQAGSPKRASTIGSYEDWTAMVREPLLWLGVGDPAQKLLDARKEGDDDEAVKVALLLAWREEFPGESVTSNMVLLTSDPDLKHALVDALHEARLDNMGNLQGVKPGEFGAYLSSIKDRIFDASMGEGPFDGLRVVRVAGRHKAGAVWKVETVDAKGKVIGETYQPGLAS